MSKHRCAAAGCAESIDRSLLMCRTHWRMVPVAVRHAVLDGWNGVAGSDYNTAVAAAIAAVEEREAQE